MAMAGRGRPVTIRFWHHCQMSTRSDESLDESSATVRGPVVWTPAPDAWDASRLGAFVADVRAAGGPVLTDYHETLRWSLAAPGDFWSALAASTGIRFHDQPTASLASSAMPGASWFPGATLNHAEQALRQASRTPHAAAIVSLGQTRPRRELTWEQ